MESRKESKKESSKKLKEAAAKIAQFILSPQFLVIPQDEHGLSPRFLVMRQDEHGDFKAIPFDDAPPEVRRHILEERA